MLISILFYPFHVYLELLPFHLLCIDLFHLHGFLHGVLRRDVLHHGVLRHDAHLHQQYHDDLHHYVHHVNLLHDVLYQFHF